MSTQSLAPHDLLARLAAQAESTLRQGSWQILLPLLLANIIALLLGSYLCIRLVAHFPRPPLLSETFYTTCSSTGPLPPSKLPDTNRDNLDEEGVFMSVVVPAYNEALRIELMLDEAVEFLNASYGDVSLSKFTSKKVANGFSEEEKKRRKKGWEVIVVDDGSVDKTREVVLDWSTASVKRGSVREGQIRLVGLEKNRGKGGAVTHGMRHIRGRYAVFADADGATKFSDLASLLSSLQSPTSPSPPSAPLGIAIGSRAHLVSTSAVVQRSFLRNLLMHGFHLFLRILGVSSINDTQCGFKLFTREVVKKVFYGMHCEGWIFDIEVLLRAERLGVGMVECPVSWHEVEGTKLSILRDSIRMAWDLVVVRGAYALAVYSV